MSYTARCVIERGCSALTIQHFGRRIISIHQRSRRSEGDLKAI
jgi:hypothetical protein